MIELARRYRSWSLVERSFHQANIAAQTWLGKQEIATQAFKDTLQVLSALLYPFKAVRAAPETIAANRLGQPGLWRFGISGDYPILLVEMDNPKQIDLVREALQVHEFLRSRRFMMDVVILNRQQTDYGAELNGMLYRLVSRMNGEEWLNQRGGILHPLCRPDGAGGTHPAANRRAGSAQWGQWIAGQSDAGLFDPGAPSARIYTHAPGTGKSQSAAFPCICACGTHA